MRESTKKKLGRFSTAVAIVLAVLALAFLLIDSSGLKQRGRSFLALIAFAVAMIILYAV